MASISSATARAKLKPRNAPYWQPHPEIPKLSIGFRRGRGRDGWYVKFNTGTTRRQARLGDGAGLDFKSAARLAREWHEAHDSRVTGTLSASPLLTVREAMHAYLQDLETRGRPTTHEINTSRAVNHVLPTFGKRQVRDLTTAEISRWHVDLTRPPGLLGGCTMSKASANRTLAVLKSALNFAVDQQLVRCEKVWAQAKAFKDADQPRADRLTDAEAERLLNAAGKTPGLRELIWAGMTTGARIGELCQMTWDDVDLPSRRWNLPAHKSKQKRPRVVPLPADFCGQDSDLWARHWGKDPDEPVYLNGEGNAWVSVRTKGPFKRAVLAAGLPKSICFYTLRHTAISRMLATGMAIDVAARVTGTSVAVIEKVYAKYEVEDLRAQMERAAPRPSSSLGFAVVAS